MAGSEKQRLRPLAVAVSTAVLVCLANGSGRADELNLTAAEKTPAQCDKTFTVEELGQFKAPKAKKPYHIEFSVPVFIPYLQAVVYGAQLAAKEAGVTLTYDVGNGFLDTAAQITQVENALTHKPDALLISPSDPDGIAPTIDETVDSGIPVFDVGTLSASTKSKKVVQDDYTQGKIAADAVAKLLPKGGPGVVVGGPPTASWARRRVAGFLDELVKHPDVKVTTIVTSDNNASDGLTKFSNAAEAHPNMDYIYVTGSFVLQPQSIPAEYRKAVYVAGSLTDTTLQALKDGSAAAMLPDFPISVGYIGLSLAVQQLNGDPVRQYNCAPVAAMFPADANKPLWLESSIMPADAALPK